MLHVLNININSCFECPFQAFNTAVCLYYCNHESQKNQTDGIKTLLNGDIPEWCPLPILQDKEL